jgi:chromosomal replication initiation ATPase DnaA
MINHIEIETKVMDFTSGLTGITPAEMRSPIRSAHIVRARAIYTYLMRLHGFSYPQIGRYLSRDHTTIINLYHHFEDHGYRAQILLQIEAAFPELAGGEIKLP